MLGALCLGKENEDKKDDFKTVNGVAQHISLPNSNDFSRAVLLKLLGRFTP